MSFRRKLFLALFSLSGITTLTLTIISVVYLSNQLVEERKANIQSTVQLFAQTIEQFEKRVELDMLNAAYHVRSKIGSRPPTYNALKELAATYK